MTLGLVRSQMTGILNRRDLQPALAMQFLSQGLARIQRTLRVPSMERMEIIDPGTNGLSAFEVPQDLLQVIALFVNGEPAEKQSFRQIAPRIARASPEYGVIQTPPAAFFGCLRLFARVGGQFYLAPSAGPDDEVMLTYYGQFEPLTDDSSANELTETMPDLLTYAGLSFAGTYFKHDNADLWEQQFQMFMAEIQDQANQLEAMGGPMVVQPAYGEY